MDLLQQIFFTTLAIAFGMLHFILFLYNRQLKSNLYFAIFAFLYAGILGTIDPVGNFIYIQIVLLIFIIEWIRAMVVGIRNKIDGAWIIAVGVCMLIICSLYDVVMDFGMIRAIYGIHNGYPFGFVGLIVSISVYLARDYAKTNEKMLQKERQAKALELERCLLEAEDARKSRELEEARQLQVSMLPQCIDPLSGIETCFEMKTATEVGGDYYDYHVSRVKSYNNC
jgi:hypothetical protein